MESLEKVSFMWFNEIYAPMGALLITSIIWFLFFRPFNLTVDYTELGYDSVNGRNYKKKWMVNQALKRRKIGQLPPPFPNSWYAVLESDQLHSGQVKEVYVLGQNLVAWRGKLNNRAFVADAYCPHLGANLGVAGSVKEDCIECPFHKWTFDGDTGKVETIPYSSNNSNQNKDKLGGLKMWKVVETNGFVYVWYHADQEEPTWYPEGYEQVMSDKWVYHGRSEFQVTCHIQEIPENGADVAHLDALHDAPAVFGERLHVLTNLLGRVIKHKWKANWNVNEDPGRGHESLVTLNHHMSLFEDLYRFFYIDAEIKQVGAGIVVMELNSPFGKGVLIQNVTPMEPLLQKITHRFYSESRLMHPYGLYVLYAEALQISRDIKVWNRKCFLQKPVLVKEDMKIKHFRRWFSQFYSEGSIKETGSCLISF